MTYVTSQGTRLWWESAGSGSTVLLVNGLGSASTSWHRLRPRLASRFRVITFDNRGAGRSDVPAEPYTFADMASDAIAVLDATEVETTHVLGLSMGGLIAQELALDYPARVRSLVLASTHVGLPLLGEADPSVARQLEQAGRLPADERAKALVSIQYAWETAEADILLDQDVASEFPTSPAGFQGQLEAAAAWARPDDLAALGIPTLVMHGVDDRMVAMAAGRRLADAIPGAEFRTFERSGHQLFTDRAEDSAAAVIDFLNSHEQPIRED